MGTQTIAPGATLSTGSTARDFSRLSWQTKANLKGAGTSTYKGGNYCGPGWGFTYQDILDGKISKLPAAVDAIDEACKAHDYCYTENGYFTQGCNLVLTYDLVKVVTSPGSTAQQRLDATLMAALFFIESQTLDIGVLARDEVVRLKDRLEGLMTQGAMTLEQAITNVLLKGR